MTQTISKDRGKTMRPYGERTKVRCGALRDCDSKKKISWWKIDMKSVIKDRARKELNKKDLKPDYIDSWREG